MHPTAKIRLLPRISILPGAKQLLDAYFTEVSGEISGLGRVSREGLEFLIEEVILFNQTASAASTDILQTAVATFINELIQEGEDPSAIKLWWHSHGTMGACWSAIDDRTIEGLDNGEWWISIIGNQRLEYCCRLDVFYPVRVTIDGLPLEVLQVPDPAFLEQVRKEIAQKVKPPQSTVFGVVRKPVKVFPGQSVADFFPYSPLAQHCQEWEEEG